MPYFKWRGVDLAGTTKRGKLFAPSLQALDTILLKRQIALLASKPTRLWFTRSISQSLKIQFFQELSLLLESGILLPDALRILACQFSNPLLQEVIQKMTDDVVHGVAFHDTLQKHPHVFQDYMIQMARTGQESGNLAHSLSMLADHLSSLHAYRKTMRSAALGPTITVVFFIAIAVIVFTAVMPTFASIFSSSGQDLPQLTQRMLAVSDWMRSWYALFVVSALIASIFVLRYYKRTPAGKLFFDSTVLALPLLGTVARYNGLIQFLSSLSLSVSCGVPLLEALSFAKKALNNSVLAQQVEMIEQDVRTGASLSEAMLAHTNFIGQDVILMTTVGEESGKLGKMLGRACVVYRHKVSTLLSRIATLIQPTLMIFIGLLVAMLIFAIYVPLFNLSHTVSV